MCFDKSVFASVLTFTFKKLTKYECLYINDLHKKLFMGYQIFGKIQFLCLYGFFKNDCIFFFIFHDAKPFFFSITNEFLCYSLMCCLQNLFYITLNVIIKNKTGFKKHN